MVTKVQRKVISNRKKIRIPSCVVVNGKRKCLNQSEKNFLKSVSEGFVQPKQPEIKKLAVRLVKTRK